MIYPMAVVSAVFILEGVPERSSGLRPEKELPARRSTTEICGACRFYILTDL
jgi:hypothetical protein